MKEEHKIERLIYKYLEENAKNGKTLFFVCSRIKISKLVVMMHNVQLWKHIVKLLVDWWIFFLFVKDVLKMILTVFECDEL